LWSRRSGHASGRRDEGWERRIQGLEIAARLFAIGVKTRLLVTKTVSALTLGALAARALAAWSKATIIARRPFLALGIRIPIEIPFRSFLSLDGSINGALVGLGIECWPIEIRLRLIAITRRAAVGLGLLNRLYWRSAFDWRGKTIWQGDEIIVVVAVVDFFPITSVAHLSLLLCGLSRSDQPEIMFGVLQQIFGRYRIAG
jgi:hypothetical protein